MNCKSASLRACAVFGLLWIFGVAPVAGADLKMLRGHVPAVTSRLAAAGRWPGTNQMRLALGVSPRDGAGLADFLAQVYDPASPNFRKYLTPAEFTARFGPTEADYEAVKNFARTNGLTIAATHGNRLVLDVTGPAAAVEKAFHLTLRTYRHPTENRDFFAPDVEPTVDAALPLTDVSGLSDYVRPHPKIRRPAAAAGAAPKYGSAPDGISYLGDDFRNAYAPGTPLTGAGQMVGLLQFDGFYANDIATYAATAGGGRANIVIQTVLLDGFSGTPTTGADSGEVEVALDIEMAMAMAPGLSQIVVFEAPNSTAYFNDILSAMAASNQIKNLSCSWGGGGPNATSEVLFQQMAAQGQSFFNASGDSDAFTGAISFPSESTNITQVGGTLLAVNGTGGSYYAESAWNDRTANPDGGDWGSSGGISPTYAIPAWQQGISMAANLGSSTRRNIPDVALTAKNCYLNYGNGGAGSAGGTSCAAPLWAGFMALVNEQAVSYGNPVAGFINPAIYAIGRGTNYNACFHDITAGDNFWPGSPTNFPAVAGYDLCTGWGTPAGTSLIYALVGSPDALAVLPTSGFVASGFVGGPFTGDGKVYGLTNSVAADLNWSVVNTSAWLNVSNPGGLLAGGTGTSATVTLNPSASSLAAGTYTAVLQFSNQATLVVQPRIFTLQVLPFLLVAPQNGFAASGPVGGPFVAASQNYFLTNLTAAALNWGVVNTSAWLAVSSPGGTLAGGAGTALGISVAPAAGTLALGSYAATVSVTNSGGSVNLNFTLQVRQSLVQNGDFETGDFTGWTLTGDAGSTNFVDNGSLVTAIAPHGGNYFAALGEPGALAYLSQTLATTAGQKYLISLWFNSPNVNPSTPNEFKLIWNGTTFYDRLNIARIGWTNLQFVATATGASTLLQIGGRDDNYHLGLDDVSVLPGFAPQISAQPASVAVLAGSNAVFSAAASGSTNLVYQWRKNGTNISNGGNISGATNSVLTFTAAAASNAGNYALVVTNRFGGSTSSVATLTVLLPPAISSAFTNRTLECGSNVTFAITAAGTPPLNYQWSLDGAPVSGATGTSLALTNVHLPNHTVTLAVTNLYGSVSSNVVLTVRDTTAPVITLNGSNPIFVELGSTFTDPGATASDACAGSLPVATSGSVNVSLVGTNLLAYKSDDGNGNTNIVIRTVIVRDTTPPAISWSFTNLTLAAVTNCAAPISNVTGTNFILATDLSGALTFSQNPTNGSFLLVGTNPVVIAVKDASGNAAYSTNAVIVQDQTPPVISVQPQNQTNTVGAAANFQVTAAACTPLSFQWFSNTVALAAGTNRTLTVASLSLAAAGNYFVVVSASGGSATSRVATLTVNLIAPGISGVVATPGGFTLNLLGSPGYTYVLQATTNLFPSANWLALATNTLGTNGAWQFTDVSATNFLRQFYRLKFLQ